MKECGNSKLHISSDFTLSICMYPILTTEVLQKTFPAWPFHNQCMWSGYVFFDMSCGSVINKGAAHLLGIKFAVLVEGSAILTQDSWAFLPVQENDDGSRNLLNASHAYVQRNCPMWCVKATKLCFQIIQLVILNFHLPYLKSVFLLIGCFFPT